MVLSEVLSRLYHGRLECCCAPAGPYHGMVTAFLRQGICPNWDGGPVTQYVRSFVGCVEGTQRLSNEAIADFHALLEYEKETNGTFPQDSILARAKENVDRELLYYRKPPYGGHGMVVLSDVPPWKPFRSSAAKLCKVEEILAGNCPALLKSMLCKSDIEGPGEPEFISPAWLLKQDCKRTVNAWVFNTGRVSEIPDDGLKLLLEAAEALGHPGSIAVQMGNAARRELDQRRDRRRRFQVMVAIMLARERYRGAAPNVFAQMLAELPSQLLEMIADAAVGGADTP